MKKCNIKGVNGIYYKDMIVIENFDDYCEYNNIVLEPEVNGSQHDIIDKILKGGIGHYAHILAETAKSASSITGQGELYLLNDIVTNMKTEQFRLISKGSKIAINKNGGYFEISNNDIIEHTNDTDYNESDIRIIKWNNGKHYYAKIGSIDVVDDDGSLKWNTHDYAMSVAKRFLEILNKNKK
jgi:hypothetical protein